MRSGGLILKQLSRQTRQNPAVFRVPSPARGPYITPEFTPARGMDGAPDVSTGRLRLEGAGLRSGVLDTWHTHVAPRLAALRSGSGAPEAGGGLDGGGLGDWLRDPWGALQNHLDTPTGPFVPKHRVPPGPAPVETPESRARARAEQAQRNAAYDARVAANRAAKAAAGTSGSGDLDGGGVWDTLKGAWDTGKKLVDTGKQVYEQGKQVYDTGREAYDKGRAAYDQGRALVQKLRGGGGGDDDDDVYMSGAGDGGALVGGVRSLGDLDREAAQLARSIKANQDRLSAYADGHAWEFYENMAHVNALDARIRQDIRRYKEVMAEHARTRVDAVFRSAAPPHAASRLSEDVTGHISTFLPSTGDRTTASFTAPRPHERILRLETEVGLEGTGGGPPGGDGSDGLERRHDVVPLEPPSRRKGAGVPSYLYGGGVVDIGWDGIALAGARPGAPRPGHEYVTTGGAGPLPPSRGGPVSLPSVAVAPGAHRAFNPAAQEEANIEAKYAPRYAAAAGAAAGPHRELRANLTPAEVAEANERGKYGRLREDATLGAQYARTNAEHQARINAAAAERNRDKRFDWLDPNRNGTTEGWHAAGRALSDPHGVFRDKVVPFLADAAGKAADAYIPGSGAVLKTGVNAANSIGRGFSGAAPNQVRVHPNARGVVSMGAGRPLLTRGGVRRPVLGGPGRGILKAPGASTGGPGGPVSGAPGWEGAFVKRGAGRPKGCAPRPDLLRRNALTAHIARTMFSGAPPSERLPRASAYIRARGLKW